MTTQEQIEVMQAYLDGKKIEIAAKIDLSFWVVTDTPAWNWEECVYRIKSEPKYRPFKDIDEAYEATKQHGDVLKRKEGVATYECPKYYTLITYCDDNDSINGCSLGHLFDNFTFFDGTPFGVEE